MRTAFLGVSNTILNKAGLNGLRSGDILSIKILDNKNGLIKALVKGRVINLKGSADLQVGKNFRVRTQWSGKTLILNRIDKGGQAAQIFGTTGVLNSDSSVLFAAAQRGGLHLKDENIKILKRLLKKNEKITDEKARLAIEAVKKGLDPEEIISIIDSGQENHEGNSEKRKLFNQLTDSEEHWFIVPYSFGLSDVRMNGSIRINKNVKTGKIRLFVIETIIDDNKLYFMIDDFNSKNKKLKIFSDHLLGKVTKKRILSGLPEILGNLSIKFDDNIIEECFKNSNDKLIFDGFSFSEKSTAGIEEII